ncbi:MAG: TetR/AcrR family transcriptional regulator [Alphaproteobacteria bacterium]|nr:MAG: TetR/AcrR family transcriptional regulator [Alphaproteobacteria bacterium]
MGRPAKFDREQAVEIVMNEIWKNGFEACSVKAMSEKLGITRSSFYNAFQSRANVFEEVLARYLEQSPNRGLSNPDENTRIIPLITRTFREICRIRASDPQARGCLVINCLTELVGVDERLGAKLERLVLSDLERLEHLLRRAAANGEIEDRGDLREKALALQNLLIGLNVMSKVVRSEEDLWAAARQTFEGLGLYAR